MHSHLGGSCPGTGYREETRDCGWASLCQVLSGRGRCGHFINPHAIGTFPAGPRGAGGTRHRPFPLPSIFILFEGEAPLLMARQSEPRGGGWGKKRTPNWQVKPLGIQGSGEQRGTVREGRLIKARSRVSTKLTVSQAEKIWLLSFRGSYTWGEGNRKRQVLMLILPSH